MTGDGSIAATVPSANSGLVKLVTELVEDCLGDELVSQLSSKERPSELAVQLVTCDLDYPLVVRLLGAEGVARRQLAGQDEVDGLVSGGRFGRHTSDTARADVEKAMKRLTKLFHRVHCQAGGARAATRSSEWSESHKHALQLFLLPPSGYTPVGGSAP